MRSAPFIRTLVFIGLIGQIVVSCSNDLNSLAPPDHSIPVVYSVLELHRDTLCVRVTKTFLGSGSAFKYTGVEDSIYFPAARVWLEKWNGEFRVNKTELVRTNLNARLPGIFLDKPNWNYLLIRTIETESLFTGTVDNQEYNLTVEIPGLPLIFAKTMAYPAAKLVSPRTSMALNLFLDPLDFAWVTEAPWSELYFNLFYSDVYPDTSINRRITWREYHSYDPTQATIKSVYGQDLMKRIAGQVKPDKLVIYRHITNFKIAVAGIPDDLHEYRLMNQVQPPDQIGFPVTNIINGIGMFTSQTLTSYELNPDPSSKDSIMYGQYTKHLNFRFY